MNEKQYKRVLKRYDKTLSMLNWLSENMIKEEERQIAELKRISWILIHLQVSRKKISNAQHHILKNCPYQNLKSKVEKE